MHFRSFLPSEELNVGELIITVSIVNYVVRGHSVVSIAWPQFRPQPPWLFDLIDILSSSSIRIHELQGQPVTSMVQPIHIKVSLGKPGDQMSQ